MVVVVLLADFDVSWISGTLREINSTFPSELDRGQLLLIHVSQEWYPPLTGANNALPHTAALLLLMYSCMFLCCPLKV